MNRIHKLHEDYTHCSRCGNNIGPGSRTTTVEVKDEIWKVDASIDVIHARAIFVFCGKCSPLYDFKKIAVGRKLSEGDLIVQQHAEHAEIKAARTNAARALFMPPDQLTDDQIRGWILEQEAAEIFGVEICNRTNLI